MLLWSALQIAFLASSERVKVHTISLKIIQLNPDSCAFSACLPTLNFQTGAKSEF